MTDSIRDSLAQVQELLGLAHKGRLYACIVEGTCCVHRDLQTPGGAGFMVDGETWNLADAEAIAASVNFLRTHSAEIAGALRDAEMLDWMAHHGASLRNEPGEGWFVLAPYHTGVPSVDGRIRFPTARAAIDAARAAERG